MGKIYVGHIGNSMPSLVSAAQSTYKNFLFKHKSQLDQKCQRRH